MNANGHERWARNERRNGTPTVADQTLFLELSEERRTIVLVTPDPEVAAATARGIEIRDGKVAQRWDSTLAGRRMKNLQGGGKPN